MKTALISILLATPRLLHAITVEIPLSSQLPSVARVNRPYTWTFSPSSFASAEGSPRYAAQGLPEWLSFDSQSRTFSGTPSESDIGHPMIAVVADNGEDAISSRFSLSVSSKQKPQVNRPLTSQLYPNNPSLSSVFRISPNSAISVLNPALRIPPGWSFSIGFEWDTFKSTADNQGLRYVALSADNSPLPSWIHFNTDLITFNGYSPPNFTHASLALHVYDEKGYSSGSLPFDVVVASHELSLSTTTSPTINVTRDSDFSSTLVSRSNFDGVLLDGKPISPKDIDTLTVDVSHLDWLHYDEDNRTLSGITPADLAPENYIPISVTSSNQTIHANITFLVLPSFFSSSTLPSITTHSFNDPINFSLVPYFSNATIGNIDDVNLTVAFDPPNAQDDLQFEPDGAMLSGHAQTRHISVTFTAYSRITHTTSHTSLTIDVNDDEAREDLNVSAHSKLILALEIAFGILGGILIIAAIFILCKRCCRAQDSVVAGEEGRNTYTAEEKTWYGLAPSVAPSGGLSLRTVTPSLTASSPTTCGMSKDQPSQMNLPTVGLGLSHATQMGGLGMIFSRVMGKKPLMRSITDKDRQASNSLRVPCPISPLPKPILRTTETLPFSQDFMDSVLMSGFSSDSIGRQSIPRQRPEFAPPDNAAQVHFEEGGSNPAESSPSIFTHAEEAIASPESTYDSEITNHPRLVPFAPRHAFPTPYFHADHDTTDPLDSDLSGISEVEIGRNYIQTDPVASTEMFTASRRSSFSSLESWHLEHEGPQLWVERPPELILLARINERFTSRVPVNVDEARSGALEAKQMSGQPIPRFLQVNLDNIRYGAVLFNGTPGAGDQGQFAIGIFLREEDICVARVLLEVVGQS